MADGCLGLQPCFAGLDALVPRVINVCVTSTPAVSEPRTAATATTGFARFPDGPAFGAYGTGDRCRGCWCVSVVVDQRCRKEREKKYIYKKRKQKIIIDTKALPHAISLQLTFASLNALKPPVINVSVAGTPAVLKPSTTRSATTDSAGFPERAALWARDRIG